MIYAVAVHSTAKGPGPCGPDFPGEETNMNLQSGAILATLAAALITALPVFSQIETGTIVGRVQDASGGAVPKAKIAIRSFATNLVVDTQSNEAGRYQSPPLKPGAYNVSVTVSGFKQSTSDVRVEVNERVGVDFV